MVLGGSTLAIPGKSGTTNSQQFNGLTVNAGASELAATVGVGGTLNVSLGNISGSVGGTIDFTLPTSGTIGATLFASSWPCSGSNGQSALACATVNGGSTWASTTYGGSIIGALTSYSSTNSFANQQFGTTLIASSTSNNGVSTGVITFNQPNTTLTVTSTGGQAGIGVDLVNSGGILVTPNATGTVITGGAFHAGNGGGLAVINTISLFDYGSLTVASGIGQAASGGSLIVSGPGTTILSGSNTYTGTTYINGPGTTILSGTNSGTGAIYVTGGKLYLAGRVATTIITVAGGATLGGSGSASSAAVSVANGGILDFSQEIIRAARSPLRP